MAAARGSADEARFFRDAAALRAWLKRHHDAAQELWLGLYKTGSGRQNMTWSEAVDEALCFGWIDGIRKRIDEERYRIRLTPRRPGSTWSAVNLRKFEQLEADGRMTEAGRAVRSQTDVERSKAYSYERDRVELSRDYEAEIRADAAAWEFWSGLSSSRRKATAHWVMSAKREDTRRRRLAILVESSSEGRLIPLLRR
ncbi:MAG: bacteriocin-protection protein [Acidobacteria bacterium]|nr:MAG: bacteriocin-protection protein [Acidobacteriota bacterium]REK10674.1 MAG: bacteriocin-protection protein [Acidobacteriota bacterium]